MTALDFDVTERSLAAEDGHGVARLVGVLRPAAVAPIEPVTTLRLLETRHAVSGSTLFGVDRNPGDGALTFRDSIARDYDI
jgi:hypothetical protein